MQRHNIPTGNFAVCSTSAEVEKAIDVFHAPIVVKADGLAAGKGVIICDSRHTAVEAAQGLFTGSLLGEAGAAGGALRSSSTGDEISFLCLSDGTHVVPLVPAQDHKRVGEGDTGPNTGGMGVYSTDELLDHAMTEWIMHHIAEPTIRGMAEEGTPFAGVLYCGLMMTARGPQVLEYNARFGDPETQAIAGPARQRPCRCARSLHRRQPRPDRSCAGAAGASACVVASSAGYPGSYKTGLPISRSRRRRAGSRRAGLPLRHGAGGWTAGDRRRPRAGRDRGRRIAARSAGPRLPGHGRDSL